VTSDVNCLEVFSFIRQFARVVSLRQNLSEGKEMAKENKKE
jgi:hypothetical protein